MRGDRQRRPVRRRPDSDSGTGGISRSRRCSTRGGQQEEWGHAEGETQSQTYGRPQPPGTLCPQNSTLPLRTGQQHRGLPTKLGDRRGLDKSDHRETAFGKRDDRSRRWRWRSVASRDGGDPVTSLRRSKTTAVENPGKTWCSEARNSTTGEGSRDPPTSSPTTVGEGGGAERPTCCRRPKTAGRKRRRWPPATTTPPRRPRRFHRRQRRTDDGDEGRSVVLTTVGHRRQKRCVGLDQETVEGHKAAAARTSSAFLKVTIPLNDRKASRSRLRRASSGPPVKQCMTIRAGRSLLLRMSKVSSQASRVWMTSVKSRLWARATWAAKASRCAGRGEWS